MPLWAFQLTEAGPDASLPCLYYTYLYRMEEMELLTGRDVAKVLKVSESMAYQLMRTEIPCVKLGCRVSEAETSAHRIPNPVCTCGI